MKKPKKFNKKKALKHPRIEINQQIEDEIEEEREFLENFKYRTGIDFETTLINMLRMGKIDAE
jgi:hypothetical protein